MGITTTYMCDKCGAKGEDKKGFRRVGIHVEEYHSVYSGIVKLDREALWCDSCLKKMGLRPFVREDSPTSPPTLEDLIIEIVKDAMANNV